VPLLGARVSLYLLRVPPPRQWGRANRSLDPQGEGAQASFGLGQSLRVMFTRGDLRHSAGQPSLGVSQPGRAGFWQGPAVLKKRSHPRATGGYLIIGGERGRGLGKSHRVANRAQRQGVDAKPELGTASESKGSSHRWCKATSPEKVSRSHGEQGRPQADG